MQRILALTHVVHAFQQKFACRNDGLVGGGNVLPAAVLNRSLSLDRPAVVIQKIGPQACESIASVHLVAILPIAIRGRAGTMIVFADRGAAVPHFTVSESTRASECHRVFPMVRVINRYMPIHLVAVRSRPAADRAQVRHYKISYS